MLVSMAKVQVIGPKRYFYDVIGSLHQLGILHIEDLSNKIASSHQIRRMSLDDKTSQLRSNLENLLIRVNGILSIIQPAERPEGAEQVKDMYYHEFWRDDTEEMRREVQELIAGLEIKARGFANRKQEIEMEFSSMQRYKSIVDKVEPLARQIVALEGFETVAFLVDSKYKAIIDIIHKELSELTHDQFEIVSADVDVETTAALAIFNRRYSTQVRQFLSGNVTEVRLPPELIHEPFDIALRKINEKVVDLPSRLAEVNEALTEISKEWFLKLSAVSEVLRDRIEEIGVVPQFAQTDFTFIITGWLPVKQLKKTQNILSDHFGDRVILTQLPVDHHELEEAPVVFENPSWARPFEIVLKILQPPRYGTIDPTPFLAVFIPAFFGLILGDVGYGILIFLGGMLARLKSKGKQMLEAVGSIFMILGVSTILFGFIYGELFGDLPHKLGWLELPEHFGLPSHISIGGLQILPFNRVESIMPLLYLCIGIGTAHIMLGLVLGIINSMREKAIKHASERAGFFLILFGFITGAVLFTLLKSMPLGLGTGGVVAVIGLALLIYGAGFIGVFEIFGLFGNIFSYARIMALGLAGVILGEVANKLGGKMGIIVGGLIAILLHTINLLVGVFSPTIHSIRLNLLEFFGKFYESGGKEYKPFKARR